MKDIQAEEAIKDWRGKRAKTIETFTHAIDTDKKAEQEVQEEIVQYEQYEDLSEDEILYQNNLHRRQRSIRYGPLWIENACNERGN